MALSYTEKRRLFASYWLGDAAQNGARAARMAGYRNAKVAASRMLRDPFVIDLIAEKFAHVGMTQGEALTRLAQLARSDMEDFLVYDPDNPASTPEVDLRRARDRGVLGCVKKVERTTRTIPAGRGEPPETEVTVLIELYPPLPALQTILKVLGLLDRRDDKPDPSAAIDATAGSTLTAAERGLDEWRKAQREKLTTALSSPNVRPTAPTSSTPTG